jgi:hypothetical protein
LVNPPALPSPVSAEEYKAPEQKAADAEAYRREERIPWTVVVDDLAGTVHRAYGGLANPPLQDGLALV